jgi:hypothetical protein
VYTNKELFSDLSGNLTGFLKVSGKYTLPPSGDEYTGTSVFEVSDPDEKLLNPPSPARVLIEKLAGRTSSPGATQR